MACTGKLPIQRGTRIGDLVQRVLASSTWLMVSTCRGDLLFQYPPNSGGADTCGVRV